MGQREIRGIVHSGALPQLIKVPEIVFPFLRFLEVVFLLFFIKLIEACQTKRNIIPLNKSVIWWLMASRAILYSASIFFKFFSNLSQKKAIQVITLNFLFFISSFSNNIGIFTNCLLAPSLAGLDRLSDGDYSRKVGGNQLEKAWRTHGSFYRRRWSVEAA